jgi:hypothetical protein
VFCRDSVDRLEGFWVHDNLVVDNGRAGIRFERVGDVAGQTLSPSARSTLKKPPGSIHEIIEANSGISPPERRRRRCALTPFEREEILQELTAGESLRTSAVRLCYAHRLPGGEASPPSLWGSASLPSSTTSPLRGSMRHR